MPRRDRDNFYATPTWLENLALERQERVVPAAIRGSEWADAFDAALTSGAAMYACPPGDPRYGEPQPPFTRLDVLEVVAAAAGENDGDPWVAVFKLNDGRFGMIEASCGATGFEDGLPVAGSAFVAATLGEINTWALTADLRRRLGIPAPGEPQQRVENALRTANIIQGDEAFFNLDGTRWFHVPAVINTAGTNATGGYLAPPESLFVPLPGTDGFTNVPATFVPTAATVNPADEPPAEEPPVPPRRPTFTIPPTDAAKYAGKWVVVTAVRDPTEIGKRMIVEKMKAVIAAGPVGIVFGGARGGDTVALKAADDARGGNPPALVVIVPGLIQQQPVRDGARAVIAACADTIIELALDLSRASSFQTRNSKMIAYGREHDKDGAPILLAFPGIQHDTGGTRNTMKVAQQWDLFIDAVEVPMTSGGVD